MTSETIPPSGTPRTFEGAIAELESIVEHLQSPELSLDMALTLFRRGTELAAECETLLSGAELQVQQLTHAVREHLEEYRAEIEDEG